MTHDDKRASRSAGGDEDGAGTAGTADAVGAGSAVNPSASAGAPRPVRLAGTISAVQGALLLGFAVYLVIHAALGHHEDTVQISGYGTAVWFVVMGGALAAAGIGLLRGKRWGRGLVIIAQLVLLPVAYYLGVGSHQWAAGVLVGLSAIVALIALFRRESLEWYAA